MGKIKWSTAAAAALLMVCACAGWCSPSAIKQSLSEVTGERVSQQYGKLPLVFVENRGQLDSAVRYVIRGPQASAFFTDNGMSLAMCSPGPGEGASKCAALRLEFEGADPGCRAEGMDELPGTVNYLVGDSSKWHTDVPTYKGVRYENVWPGIDISYHGANRQLKYDISVAPGADLSLIRLRYDGAQKIWLDASGDLHVQTAVTTFVENVPGIYQERILRQAQDEQAGSGRQALRGGYVLLDDHTVGFRIQGRDPNLPLVIDPASDLVYSTFLGGSSSDGANSVAVDSSGCAYVAGYAWSADFPTTAGAFRRTINNYSCDAYVTKLNASGSALVYSTYLGGGGYDCANSIAVDSSGCAYVTGQPSYNFPTTSGAFQEGNRGGNSFVAKLNPTGSGLIYSTYLGGTSNDYAYSIALDASGCAYVGGLASSTDFPTTTGAFQRSYGGLYDGFVTKLNSTGSGLVYSTFLGGDSFGYVQALTVDSSGCVYATGSTGSYGFPTTPGAFQEAPLAYDNAFVSKLNASGSALVYSTFLGGEDDISTVAVDSSGCAYVAGQAWQPDTFPTTPGAFQTELNGEAFVTKLNATGSGLVYSTFIGGTSADPPGTIDGPCSIRVDSSGCAFVAGNNFMPASSSPVRATASADAAPPAYLDNHMIAFVLKLNADGSGLDYSKYFTGSNYSISANSMAIDSSGGAYLVGETNAPDFPTTSSAFRRTLSGGTDGFVTKLRTSRTLDVPLFSQGAAACGATGSFPWGPLPLGSCASYTVGCYGCAVTSAAMVLKYYGVNTDPRDLNTYLTNHNGYTSNGECDDFIDFHAPPGCTNGRVTDAGAAYPGPNLLSTIKDEINQGYPVITEVRLGTSQHFVVITGYSGSTFFMNDPWYNEASTIPNSHYGPNATSAIHSIWRYHGSSSPQPTNLAANPPATIADGTAKNSSILILHLSDPLGEPITGKQIAFSSSRGSVDTIIQPATPTDASGMALGWIESSTPGTAQITAQNTTDSVYLNAGASVTFVRNTGGPVITSLTVDPSPVVALGAAGPTYSYHAGVFWHGDPGKVIFKVNGKSKAVTGTDSGAVLQIDQSDLNKSPTPGTPLANAVSATAYNAAGAVSAPMNTWFPVVQPPPWLTSPSIGVGNNQLTLKGSVQIPSQTISATCTAPGVLSALGGAWGLELSPLTFNPTITLSPGPSQSQPLTGSFQVSGQWEANVKCGVSCAAGVEGSVSGSGTVSPSISLQSVDGVFSRELGGFNTPKIPLPAPLSFIDSQVSISPSVSGDVRIMEGQPELVPGMNLKFDSSTMGLTVNVDGTLSTGKQGLAYVQGSIGGRPYADAQFPGNPSSCCCSPYLQDIGVSITANYSTSIWQWTKEGSATWELLKCPSGSQIRMGAAAPAVVHKRDRSYLNAPGGYMVFRKTTEPVSSSKDGAVRYGYVEGMPGPIMNVGPDPRPALAVQGDTGMLVFVYDDGSKPLGQSEELYFATYGWDGWSTQAPITDNLYPDNQPAVAYDGAGNAVVVWTTAPTATGSETDPTQILPQTEIAYSAYDSSTSTWSPPAQLTSNSSADCMPILVQADYGMLKAFWLASTDNSFPIWPDDQVNVSAQIWESDWNESSFGTPTLVIDGVSTDSKIAAVSSAVGDVIAWSQDTDSNSQTTADREIYVASRAPGGAWNSPVQLTNDSYGDLMPSAALDASGNPVVAWTKAGVPTGSSTEDQLWGATFDGADWSTPAMAFSAPGIQEPNIVADSWGNLIVLWVAESTSLYNLYYSVYDSANCVWGSPQQLTNDIAAQWMISPAAGDGNVLAAYVSREVDTSGTLPQIGLSDLYLISQDLPTDLSIADSDLSVVPSAPSRGATATVQATVHCCGEFGVNDVSVAFYDGDPNKGGSLIDSSTIPLIAPGSAAVASVTWNVPADSASHRVFALVNSDWSVNESDMDNNQASILVFGADLVPYPPAIAGYPSDNWVSISSTLANNGSADAESAMVEFHLDSADGPVLYSETIPDLIAGTQQTVTFAWDTTGVSGSAHLIYAIADPNAWIDENKDNDTAVGTVYLLPDIVINQIDPSMAQSGTTMTASVTLSNPTPFAAGSFPVRVTAGGATLAEASVSGLSARESQRVSISWDTTGQAYTCVDVQANPDQTVTEVSYTNNSLTLATANVQTIGQSKQTTDGTDVGLSGKKVTGVFAGYFYMEEPDRSAGIKVTSSVGVGLGDIVSVTGLMNTSGGELSLDAITVSATSDPVQLTPLAISAAALGGGSSGNQQGVTGGYGTNNIGLLVRVWGKVTQIGDGYLYIEDASALTDGTITGAATNAGVRVICDPSRYGASDFLGVTGISSCFEAPDGQILRCVLPRGTGDIGKY